MRTVLVPDGDGATLIRTDESGRALGQPLRLNDVAAAVREIEAAEHPRWVWEDTARVYSPLLAAGVRVQRCHDLTLTGALLETRAGRYVPVAETPVDDRLGLFDAVPWTAPDVIVERHRRQAEAIEGDPRLRLLVAAESAGGLTAAEMSFDGLPFSAAAHRALLEEALGPRVPEDMLPDRLRAVADDVSAAFGRRVNPASQPEVVAAFAREGIELHSTRSLAYSPLLRRGSSLRRLETTWFGSHTHQWSTNRTIDYGT
ncbi:hypothetical protein AB4Z09_12815 [Rhodococcus sp. TAF43]|uniref:hypothetical protein n=1 Tax=Rhodococcus sp. TAF43 TaxID=3237483 RepID=UPI003F980390